MLAQMFLPSLQQLRFWRLEGRGIVTNRVKAGVKLVNCPIRDKVMILGPTRYAGTLPGFLDLGHPE